jgi:hypothetical protein
MLLLSTNASMLILLVAVCVMALESTARSMEFFLDPIGKWFRSLGFTQQDFEAPDFQYFVGPVFIGGEMSGPPPALGLIFGWLVNRYELVITRSSDKWMAIDRNSIKFTPAAR